MPTADLAYLAIFLAALALATPFLGTWLAAVLTGEPPRGLRWLAPAERAIYRIGGVDATAEMSWRGYAGALVAIHLAGFAALLTLQLAQAHLPLNPAALPAVPLGVAVNTAVSFVTNTNWQAYSGEATMSYLTQMTGLGVQNFLSAATGLAVLAALARGFSRKTSASLGNFWADLVRGTLYVLVPLSLVLAVVLVAQGVVMSFAPYAKVTTLAGAEQVIPLGPAASQVAIKQLGTNGGGFFGQNSAHPFENPTALSNFLQTLAILLLPAACVYAYGVLTGARRHAWVIYGVMMGFFIAALGLSLWSEHASPAAATLALEGKELRFGVTPSVLWANATTVASNGSVNAMHSSLSPLTGGIALLNMLLGEIIFGGVGSGLYGMVLMIAILDCVHRRTDGRSHARVSRQENRGARGEDSRCWRSLLGACLAILGFTACAAVTFAEGRNAVPQQSLARTA